MQTSMCATRTLVETAHEAIVLAFLENDSTINVRVPLNEATRLSKELDRAVREASGIRVALNR